MVCSQGLKDFVHQLGNSNSSRISFGWRRTRNEEKVLEEVWELRRKVISYHTKGTGTG